MYSVVPRHGSQLPIAEPDLARRRHPVLIRERIFRRWLRREQRTAEREGEQHEPRWGLHHRTGAHREFLSCQEHRMWGQLSRSARRYSIEGDTPLSLSVSAASSPAASYGSSKKMLRLGSSGARVMALQRMLRAAGFNPQGIDGKFGPKTLAALRAFQRASRIIVDGRAGPQTFGALGRWLGGSKPSSNPAKPSQPSAPSTV